MALSTPSRGGPIPRPAVDARDRRDVANYTIAEAARWFELPPSTLHGWLRSGARERSWLLPRSSETMPGLSFWNLVECSILAAIRAAYAGAPRRLRPALDEVRAKLGVPRPLITKLFACEGVRLLTSLLDEPALATRARLPAARSRLDEVLARIEFDETGLAARVFPCVKNVGEPRLISIDPRIAFGRPVLADTGVTIEVLLDRWRAGDSVARLADDYRLPRERIVAMTRRANGRCRFLS